MNLTKIFTFLSFLLFIQFFSCNDSGPVLNGHYHLILPKQFGEIVQVWNIRENKMVINEKLPRYEYEMPMATISFNGDTIFVDPWVDFTYSAKYLINENGSVILYGDSDTMMLVPHRFCLTSEMYFFICTNTLCDSFQLVGETMTGKYRFPSEYKNELIVCGHSSNPSFVFNKRKIQPNEEGKFGFTRVQNEEIWVHIDKHITIKAFLPAILELYSAGYKVFYSGKVEIDNNEQVKLLTRHFVNYKNSDDRIEVEYCENCEKYPNVKIDSLVIIEVLTDSRYKLNGMSTDLFQLRNSVANMILLNRTTRLKTLIEIYLDGNVSFNDYLHLLDEFGFIIEGEITTTFYRDPNDPDADYILEQQEKSNDSILKFEFPIRIKEIIKK